MLPQRFRQWLGLKSSDAEVSLGQRGEKLAARHLKAKRFKILARNARLPIGEIDLIALDGSTLVFIEVKTRLGTHKGHPTEAITPAKQRKLTQLAIMYRKQHGLLEHPGRFDVVAVTFSEGESEPVIEHYVNAFEAV